MTRSASAPSAIHRSHQHGTAQLRRYAVALVAAWSALVAAAWAWTAWSALHTVTMHATEVAITTLQKDVVYRRWASGHGGVYVPVTADTPPNPYLAHLPERDLTTPSGRQLTLVNPAYMTRQVHELGRRDYGLRGHITSLNPLRPENAPDDWERAALALFAGGATEATAVAREGEPALLRHMRALRTEASCLKCHGHQGYREGEVRGGISVSVPLDGYEATAWDGIRQSAALHAVLWLAGVALLGLGYRSLARGIDGTLAVQRRYQDLVETSHDLIWQLDREGRIVYLNPAWEQALGIPTAELVGQPFTSIKDQADLERGGESFARLMAEGGSLLDQESVFRHRDGRAVHLIINARAIRDARGAVTGCRGTAFDNTERCALGENLRQAEKLSAVGQLAGGIAHDFNNQLAGILGYAELLARRIEDPATRGYAERIAVAAQRSADLTGKLLAFARKGSVLSVPVDLHAAIHETIALLGRSIDRRIAISARLDAPAARVRGDPSQLQNALLNLGINARDAMAEGGTLTFATRLRALAEKEVAGLPGGAYVEVAVSDTGCGMDERVKAHLFEPFFTTKGPGKGTGMGLAAVYGTLTGHGGRILVESSPGRGSTFRLLLPLLGDAPAPAEATPAEPAVARLRILVAEDEPLVSELLVDLLRGDGHEVTAAADGRQALEGFRAHHRDLDLVILDLMMPHLDGTRCFHEMRALAPRVRVLLASGFPADGAAQALLAAGAAGFIQKPFRRDQLRRALAAAMSQGGRPGPAPPA